MTATQRFECKYVVSESTARRLRASLTSLIRPDPHAARRPDFTYPICSLYLDARGLDLYRETVEGKKSRFKLRVRCYSDDAAVPVFLEVKRRVDGVVRKSRCPIPRAALPAVLGGGPFDASALTESQRRGYDEFVHLMHRTQARPKLMVRYDREAYVGAFDDDVRVTFDRRLRVLTMLDPDVRIAASGFRAVTSTGVVLELKFSNRRPSWLAHVVDRFELQRTSFSKYCKSVDRAGLPRGAAADVG